MAADELFVQLILGDNSDYYYFFLLNFQVIASYRIVEILVIVEWMLIEYLKGRSGFDIFWFSDN